MILIIVFIILVILSFRTGNFAETLRNSRNDPNEHIHFTPSSIIALGLVLGLIVGCYFVVKAIFPDFPSPDVRRDLRSLLVLWPLGCYGIFHRIFRKQRS